MEQKLKETMQTKYKLTKAAVEMTRKIKELTHKTIKIKTVETEY